MAASSNDLEVKYGPHTGRLIGAPHNFYEIINNSDDRDIVITILSLVLPLQKRNLIHTEIRQTSSVFELLFFNGTFTREVIANIKGSFSSVYIKLPNEPYLFSIEQILSDLSIYYNTTIFSSAIAKDAVPYQGCLVVEVEKNWRFKIGSSLDLSRRVEGQEKSARIMGKRSGKIEKSNKSTKSSKFIRAEGAVHRTLQNRSLMMKILDSLVGVRKDSIECKVLEKTDGN
jgi:hypothetical protein